MDSGASRTRMFTDLALTVRWKWGDDIESSLYGRFCCLHHPHLMIRRSVFLEKRRNTRRSAFTLIELMLTVAVIMVLLGITFGISTGVKSAQNRSRAQADLAILSQALERYKSTHGDYPWTESGNVSSLDANAEVLFQALMGWKAFRRTNGVTDFRDLEVSEVPSAGPKAFIDPNKLLVSQKEGSEYSDEQASLPAQSNQQPSADIHILDPWGNPYVYVYGKSSGAGNSWENFGYHLYSMGADGSQDSSAISASTGIQSNDYRDSDENADNVYIGD